jgi:conjugative transfer signal peptidase TraF
MFLKLLFFSVLSFCAVAVTVAPWTYWNWTGSLPVGCYLRTRNPSDRYVVFNLTPDEKKRATASHVELTGKPLMKTIIPLQPGETLQYSEQGFRVNGKLIPHSAPLAKNRYGEPMPHFPFGTYSFHREELWVVSSFDPRSYDSRYFGPIMDRQIIGYARPLATYAWHAPAN